MAKDNVALTLGTLFIIANLSWGLWRLWQDQQLERRLRQQMLVRRAAREEMRSLPRYTMRDVRRYNGHDGGPLLMAVDGLVFDVTEGQEFYGIDGCYRSLMGCDATRLLAKGILERESEEESRVPLTTEEHEQLRDWKQHYDIKYGPALGELQVDEVDHANLHAKS